MSLLVALLLAAAAPAPNDQVTQAEIAVFDCEHDAAKQWDDQISDATTIAAIVVRQCAVAREAEAKALIASVHAQSDVRVADRIREDVVGSEALTDAIFAVVEERKFAKIRQQQGRPP